MLLLLFYNIPETKHNTLIWCSIEELDICFKVKEKTQLC